MKDKFLFTCRAIALILVSVILVVPISGQKSWGDIKSELRKLDGSTYIKTAGEYAESLALQKKFDESYELLKKSTKKAKTISPSAYLVVLTHRAEVVADYFPRTDEYNRDLVESLQEIAILNPPNSIVDRVDIILEAAMKDMNGKYTNDLAVLREAVDLHLAERKEEVLTVEEEGRRGEILSLNKEEAFEEIEKLKFERERLEGLQVKLSETVRNSEKQLTQRTKMINEMTADKAKKEALLEYNLRMIDSLRFVAELDSFNLISQERLIREQEAEIKLQNSTLLLQESELKLKSSRQRLYVILSVAGLLIGGFATWMFVMARRNNRRLAAKNIEIETERERSEELLLNILPKDIASELKEHAKVQTRKFDECTVCFTDFINFSRISQILSPEELISALDECFKAFDDIISKYNVEKIKTIGDSYMCAAGVPISNKSHAKDAVMAAIEMVKFLDKWNKEREDQGLERFDARIGIHTGPIIAGVVGVKKFAYDIWGDTVNVAARMESQSEAQKINISQSTYDLIKGEFSCESRGSMDVKNMRDLEMYFVETMKQVPSLN